MSKQGTVPGGRTSRNFHRGGGPDLDFEGALGFGGVESVHPSWRGGMSSTAIYWVPAACGCCACRGEALGQSGERYRHCGGQCPEGLGGGWKKSPVFINRILSKALKGLFGYPGPGFSQAEAGQVGLQELVTSTLCMVPALRLDLQAWRRRGRMPTGTAASEKAKVKDRSSHLGSSPLARESQPSLLLLLQPTL